MANNLTDYQVPSHPGQYDSNPAVQEAEAIVREAYDTILQDPELSAAENDSRLEGMAAVEQKQTPEVAIVPDRRIEEAAARQEIDRHHAEQASPIEVTDDPVRAAVLASEASLEVLNNLRALTWQDMAGPDAQLQFRQPQVGQYGESLN